MRKKKGFLVALASASTTVLATVGTVLGTVVAFRSWTFPSIRSSSAQPPKDWLVAFLLLLARNCHGEGCGDDRIGAAVHAPDISKRFKPNLQ